MIMQMTLKNLAFSNVNLGGPTVGGTYSTSYTNKCQWRGFMALTPGDIDAMAKTVFDTSNTNTLDADRNFILCRSRVKVVLRNNSSNDVCMKMYKLTCRRPFMGPVAESKFAPTVTGNNPGIISNTTWTETAAQSTLEDYREVDYLPYDNTLLCSYFKIKDLPARVIKPGEEITIPLKIYKRYVGFVLTRPLLL